MATPGGKKKKSKGKTLNLNDFLANEGGPGTSYVLADKPVSWAEEVDSNNLEESDYGAPIKPLPSRAALPTAPRSAMGTNIDMSTVPTAPPFTAFLGNLPFDVDEEEIIKFFHGLKVSNVRIPSGQSKGFGYAEFEERTDLVEALGLNDQQIRNRKIRIDLAGHREGGDRDRNDRWRDRDEQDVRTGGDWRSRSGPSDGYGDRDGGRFGGSRYGDRDGGRYGDRDGGRYGDRDGGRYGDRDGGNDSGPWRRPQTESRYGSDDRERESDSGPWRRSGPRDDRDNDRYGGDRYGSRGGDRDRGFGGDRYGDRYSDRDRGYGGDRGDRYGDRDGGRRFGSGYSRDERRDDRDDYRTRREESYRDIRRDEPEPAKPAERRRLNLAPRSKPVESESTSSSSSIFGAARPVDTAAKEREIEERLIKQREADHERDHEADHERKLSSDSKRRDSEGRERKASSSSGKGIRTVAPPRVRSDSQHSEEDVFDEKVKAGPRSPPVKSDSSTKLVPAPPPKENPWTKKVASPPSSGAPSSENIKTESSSGENINHSASSMSSEIEETESGRTIPETDSKASKKLVDAPPPKANAWGAPKPASTATASNGQPANTNASAPSKDNAWTKKKAAVSIKDAPIANGEERHERSSHRNARGGSARRGQGDFNRESSRGGHGAGRGKKSTKSERPLPQSIDEMPKYEEHSSKDWSDANKFSSLMADEDDDAASQ